MVMNGNRTLGFLRHNLKECTTPVKAATYTVIFLSFRADRSEQTVHTQIRLLLEEQSDHGLLVCNSLCIFWMHYSKETPSCSTFRVITINFRVSEILGFLWYSSSMPQFGIHIYSMGFLPTEARQYPQTGLA